MSFVMQATSRAKALLVACAHPQDLYCSPLWQDLIYESVLDVDSSREGAREVMHESFESPWLPPRIRSVLALLLLAPRLRLRVFGRSGHRSGRRARTRLEGLRRRRLAAGGARRLGRPVHRDAVFLAHCRTERLVLSLD